MQSSGSLSPVNAADGGYKPAKQLYTSVNCFLCSAGNNRREKLQTSEYFKEV